MTRSQHIHLYSILGITLASVALIGLPGNTRAEDTANIQAEVTTEVNVDTRRSPFQERWDQLRSNFEERKEARTEAREEFKGNLENRKENAQQRQEERKTSMEDRREDMKARFEERKAEIKNNIAERLEGFLDRVKERFTAAIARLETLADRIESRAEKLKSEGSDISVTTKALAEARADLDTAETFVTQLSTGITTNTSTSSMRENFGTLRKSIAEVKATLKKVHEHLREAVIDLKGKSKLETKVQNSTETSIEVE